MVNFTLEKWSPSPKNGALSLPAPYPCWLAIAQAPILKICQRKILLVPLSPRCPLNATGFVKFKHNTQAWDIGSTMSDKTCWSFSRHFSRAQHDRSAGFTYDDGSYDPRIAKWPQYQEKWTRRRRASHSLLALCVGRTIQEQNKIGERGGIQ